MMSRLRDTVTLGDEGVRRKMLGPVLVTGARGNIGGMLVNSLSRDIRPFDIVPGPVGTVGSVTDLTAVKLAAEGCDAVIHLAGIADEAPFDQLLEANLLGTYNVLQAAVERGASTVVLASSNHAAGYQERMTVDVPAGVAAQPDSLYGVSKSAAELLGELFHRRYGLNVVCVRIGTCYTRPFDVRSLSTWLSPADAVRLFEACLLAKGLHKVWGISRNTRRWWSLEEGNRIGYFPQDDAEKFAPEVVREADNDRAPQLGQRYVGGFFLDLPLGVRRS